MTDPAQIAEDARQIDDLVQYSHGNLVFCCMKATGLPNERICCSLDRVKTMRRAKNVRPYFRGVGESGGVDGWRKAREHLGLMIEFENPAC